MRRSSWVLLSGLPLLAAYGSAAFAGSPAPASPELGTPTPATTPAATPDPSAPQTQEANDAAAQDALSAVNRDLLTAEEAVDKTKERVFRAKATLQLLKEIVIEGSSNGGQLLILHENRLGAGFNLEAVTYLLDGQTKMTKADVSGALDQNRELKVSEGTVPSGNHTLSVDFKVRPTGYGLFKYAQDYTIDVRSSYQFAVDLGKTCTLRASISEKGGAVQQLQDRAKTAFDIQCETVDGK